MKRRQLLAALPALLLAIAGAAREYTAFDVVGDSISAGVNPDCTPGLYGWVHRLFGQAGCGQPAPAATLTNLWPGILAYNSAVPGSRAADWAAPGSPLMCTVTNHHPDLVVVFIGGNDGLAYAADGVITPEEREQFRTNLTAIIRTLQSGTPPPELVVVNYYDLFDGFSTNLPPLFAVYRAASQAAVEGNRLIAETAASNGCFFVNIYDDFLHHAYGAELGDSNHLSPDYFRLPLALFDIHPVTAGHAAIHALVYERLQELKQIPRFVHVGREADAVELRWSSGVGQQYQIGRSTNLLAGFVPVATNAATPPRNTFREAVGDTPAACYRLIVLP
jgi:lysophospholipase L1-like esterase